MLRPISCAMVLVFLTRPALAQTTGQSPPQLTDVFMATVRLTSPKSSATGFILVRPKTNVDEPPRLALVTSAHVFEKSEGEEMTIGYRRKDADGGFVRVPTPLKVRASGKPLWTRHAQHDVATIAIEAPAGVETPRVSIEQLATIDDIKAIEPGEIVNCVTYPHAPVFEPNQPGFPVVRMGCMASYPLWSLPKEPTFLVDYNAFEGDSGGPVILKVPAAKTSDGAATQSTIKILGLVQGQHLFKQRFDLPYESGESRKSLGLGIVLNAQAIRDTLLQLP